MFTALERRAPFLWYCGPSIVYAVTIFAVSSLPGDELPPLSFFNLDKAAHFLEFGLFGMLLYRAFRLYHPLPKPYILTIAVGIPYAALDELHQYFVPGRNASIADFVFDAAGLAVFAWISALLRRPRQVSGTE